MVLTPTPAEIREEQKARIDAKIAALRRYRDENLREDLHPAAFQQVCDAIDELIDQKDAIK